MKSIVPEQIIEQKIYVIRGKKVILDADLAVIYGVTTKRLNEQVRRNRHKFPDDFVFRLNAKEMGSLNWSQNATSSKRENLRSQNATSSSEYGGRRYLPYAFTEHGAIMTATILNSPQAVQMSVFVVRAFVRMREILAGNKHLAKQLVELEKKLTGRLDVHEVAIVDVLRRIMELLDPPAPSPEPPKRAIGFHVKE